MSCRWSFEGSLARNAFLRSCNVNGIASGAAGWVADGVLKEVSHEMRFWEIADARNPVFFQTKCVPERRWSTSAVRRVRDGLMCGRIILGSFSDHGRIMVGSVPHCHGVSSVFRACAVDRIPLWFATVGSFPQCKWDCKWCCGGWVADGVLKEVSHEMRFWEIADARKPMFFHTKSVPERRWSTPAVRRVRDGLVCGRIILGSWSDHGRMGSAL